MRQLLTIALVFNLSALTAQENSDQNDIKGLKLVQYVINTDTSGKTLFSDSSFINIYSNGSLRLCDMSYEHHTSYNTIELLSEIRRHYFIYSADSSYGLDYDGHMTPIIRNLQVDSVLAMQWFYHNNLRKFFSLYTKELISSGKNDEDAILNETYLLKLKTDQSSQTTCRLGYVKEAPGMHLDPLGDPNNRKDMRLCKVRMITECPPCKIEINYTLDEITEINPDIISLFADYRKSINQIRH